MADDFRYDPATYRERVSRIARHVVPNDDAMPTIVPQDAAAADAPHAAAVTTRDRLGRRVGVAAQGGAA